MDVKTGQELTGEAIPKTVRCERISSDGRFFARLNTDRVEVIPLIPDEEEIAYRRLHTQPSPSRYRSGYLAARAAKDDFAAALYLNLIPPDERKGLIAQAEADALAALSRLADEYWRGGKLEEAVPLRIEILNVNKAKFGPEALATINSAAALGSLYQRMGQFEKAIPLYEDVLKHRKAKFGREDPQTLYAMRMLGEAYRDGGRLPEAIALLEEAATKKDARTQRSLLDAYALDLLARLGRAYLGLKKWAEAETHLRECVTICEKTQPDDWNTFDAQSMLGGSLLDQKKYTEAEPLLLKGLRE